MALTIGEAQYVNTLLHVVWCETGPCEHVEVATGKVDAQTRQRKHAFRHRTERNRVARSAGTS